MNQLLRTLLFGLLLPLLALTACGGRNSQQNQATDVNISLESTSNQVGEAILLVSITDNEGQPITDAAVAVEGNMTHAGMVPVNASLDTANADNMYEIPFEWTMGGDWFVTVNATLVDGREISQVFDGISISSEGSDSMDEMDHEEMDMEEGDTDHSEMDMDN